MGRGEADHAAQRGVPMSSEWRLEAAGTLPSQSTWQRVASNGRKKRFPTISTKVSEVLTLVG